MSEFIPLSVPSIQGNEWTYVKQCLDTGWVSSAGSFVDKFEKEIARFTGSKHAIACANGTSAIHVALQVAGVQEGDEVIVPTLTFIAPVNAVRYLHAQPVFMDCDDVYGLDPVKTIEFIRNETWFEKGVTTNKRTGRRIAALLPVHVFGNAVWMDDLAQLCSERNIPIVEDATESLGTIYTKGRYKQKHAGTVGTLGCLSFNGNKIITTGGGGMILTDDAKLAERAKYLTTQAKDDEVRYVHHEVGYNFRLTNIQAAVGVAQLELLPGFLVAKKKNFEAYRKGISGIKGLHLAEGPVYADNNYWMYLLQIDAKTYGRDREKLWADLDRAKVQARPVWHLNHLQKPYAQNQSFKIEKAITLHRDTLNIPCSTNLTEQQVETVIRHLKP